MPAGWEHKVEEAKREEESRRQRKLQQKALKVSLFNPRQFHAVKPQTIAGVQRLRQHPSIKPMLSVLQAAESEDEEEEMDPEMAVMMGFGGFGTTKQ